MADVGPALEEVGGVGVAQHVGRDLEPHLRPHLLHDVAHRHLSQAPAPLPEESDPSSHRSASSGRACGRGVSTAARARPGQGTYPVLVSLTVADEDSRWLRSRSARLRATRTRSSAVPSRRGARGGRGLLSPLRCAVRGAQQTPTVSLRDRPRRRIGRGAGHRRGRARRGGSRAPRGRRKKRLHDRDVLRPGSGARGGRSSRLASADRDRGRSPRRGPR